MDRSSARSICAALALMTAQHGALHADETAPASIAAIVRAAHVKGGRAGNQTLDLRVIRGRATDDEKKQLLGLYEALAKFQPPAGSREGWKKDTQALLDAARDAIQGEPEAAARLTTATNCARCHDKYRFGRTISAGQSVFLKAAPPELVEVAGMHPREGYVIVYSFKTTPITKFATQEIERVVVIDGRKTVVKETVKVPVTEQKREAVESTLKVHATGGVAGAENYRVLDLSGQEVSGEELWKRLKPGQIVLRQAGPGLPDAAYLKLFAADALIFVLRAPDLPPATK